MESKQTELSRDIPYGGVDSTIKILYEMHAQKWNCNLKLLANSNNVQKRWMARAYANLQKDGKELIFSNMHERCVSLH